MANDSLLEKDIPSIFAATSFATVSSIPKTFTLGIREKRYEAGMAFGCLVRVGDLPSFNALFGNESRVAAGGEFHK